MLKRFLKSWWNEKHDKRVDKLISKPGTYLSSYDSGLMDYSLINEVSFAPLRDLSYPDFMDKLSELVDEEKVRIVPVKDYRSPEEDFKTDVLGYKVYTLEMGNPSARHKIVVEGTCHGGEKIHSLSCMVALMSLAKPGALREKLLHEVHISFLPAADPLGWHKKTRAYVSMEGEETRNPVVVNMAHIRNLFGWSDANSVFGRNLEEAKSPRIRSIEKHFLQSFGPPTLYNSLHETVMHGSHLFYENAGVMILLHDYFPEEVRQSLYSLRYALTTTERVEKKLRRYYPLADLKYMEEYLTNHPTFEKTKSIRNYIKNLRIRTMEDKFFRVEREFPIPGPKTEISIAESLLINGPFYVKAGIVLAPDYYERTCGTVGRTIETFSQSETERVLQGVAFIDGSLRCEILGEYY